MRPVRYNVAASLDGFIATADGGYDWIPADDTIDFGALFGNVDTVLLGRHSYELVQQQDGEKAWKPDARLYVFSTTMRQRQHEGITVVNDHAAEVVASLRQEEGTGDIWLFGGGHLFSSLLAAGQVDKVEIAVCPVLLGGGIPLNIPGTPMATMTLESAKTYPSGIVILTYAVNHAPTR